MRFFRSADLSLFYSDLRWKPWYHLLLSSGPMRRIRYLQLRLCWLSLNNRKHGRILCRRRQDFESVAGKHGSRMLNLSAERRDAGIQIWFLRPATQSLPSLRKRRMISYHKHTVWLPAAHTIRCICTTWNAPCCTATRVDLRPCQDCSLCLGIGCHK